MNILFRKSCPEVKVKKQKQCVRGVVSSPCMRSPDGQLKVQLVARLKLQKEYMKSGKMK